MSRFNETKLDVHTCGAADDREANVLLHLILAEIRKSNAPSWVAEELEKNGLLKVPLSANAACNHL